MKPGTPLPWSIRKNETTRMVFLTGPGFPLYKAERPYSIAPPSQPEQNREQDAAYIVHAANLYPELVAALEGLTKAIDMSRTQQVYVNDLEGDMDTYYNGADFGPAHEWARYMLAKCGEE